MRKTLLSEINRKKIYLLEYDNGKIEYFVCLGVLKWNHKKELYTNNIIFRTMSVKDLYNEVRGF